MDDMKDYGRDLAYRLLLPALAGFCLFLAVSCGAPCECPGNPGAKKSAVVGAVAGAVGDVARGAAPFLPPPYNYLATLAAGLLGEYGRKTVARKIRKRRRGKRAAGRSPSPEPR